MNDKICGYYLDEQQKSIVLDDSNHLLVVAGAGSGKTLTILGKIYYLVKYKNISEDEILCISFTRASSDNLKEKIKKELLLNIPVYTFHKLGLEILKDNKAVCEIAESNSLENIIHEFFSTTILSSEFYMLRVLQYFRIKKIINIKKTYLKFYNNNCEKIEILEKIISTFIHLFKCNNYSISDFSLFLKQTRFSFVCFRLQKEKIFLLLTLNIYLIYQSYLEENGEIDFDDMIIKSSQLIEDGGKIRKYKYIIIDEYQDTSYIRFILIKNILNKTGAKLMAVGDDFQSIYRFTGCDIALFLRFNSLFPDAKVMKIENTYRNSQELVSVASDFVMRNKYQIRKQLRSNKRLMKPIRLIYYKNISETFLKLVLRIFEETQGSILVLGRNNKDINMLLGKNFTIGKDNKVICNEKKDIDIYYLTVHKSKGLEADNVIIINLEDKISGFPNQIEGDKVLRFVNQSYDSFPFSEERRLFYVALTRTKNYVYLLVPIKNQSVFVSELVKNKKHIEIEKY
ncbi:MAG: UvrD-helicase domain-containing protein [Bacilli bacterium]|nr:UvrD-helicase domain-containing protein [Bacilli bacterium]